MSLTNYTDLTAGVANWLSRSDLTALIPDFITLFEAEANRRLRVRQQEATVILTPSVVATVTGAANNGSGLIRLTVPTTGMSTSDQVTVGGIVGTTEANTVWNITVIDSTHIDLIGSTFTNAYTSGGTVTDVGNAPLPSDYLAWRQVSWLGNPLRNLDYVHPSVMTTYWPQIPIDLPNEFTIEGSVLRIMPQDPTALKFLYWQKIPSLQANTTNWLMTAHPDLYLFGTLVEATAKTKDAETAVLWKARRDELFDEVTSLNNKTRGPASIRTMGPTP